MCLIQWFSKCGAAPLVGNGDMTGVDFQVRNGKKIDCLHVVSEVFRLYNLLDF